MSAQLALALGVEPRSIAVPGIPATIQRTFALTAIAEEELERVGNPRGAFALLFPGPLAAFTPDLYRLHCRELLARLAAGEDTRPGTKPEVLIAMMATAERAPLRAEGQAVAEQIFAELFPDRAARFLDSEPAAERWKGQVAEDVAAIRKRLAQPWRVLAQGGPSAGAR